MVGHVGSVCVVVQWCALSKAIHNMYFLLQRILDMDGAAQPHECVYIDEAGLNLSIKQTRGA